MRGGIFLILSMTFTAAGGYALCHLAKWDAQPQLMMDAAAVGLLASLAAIVPLLLNHSRSPLAISQSALVGTSLHLLVSIVVGAGVLWLNRLGAGFVYWVSAFYWATLAVVCMWYVKALRGAAKDHLASQGSLPAASAAAASKS